MLRLNSTVYSICTYISTVQDNWNTDILLYLIALKKKSIRYQKNCSWLLKGLETKT